MTIKIPAGASTEEIRNYLRWIDTCKELGWPDEGLKKLAKLWWQYHQPAPKGNRHIYNPEGNHFQITPISTEGEKYHNP